MKGRVEGVARGGGGVECGLEVLVGGAGVEGFVQFSLAIRV